MKKLSIITLLFISHLSISQIDNNLDFDGQDDYVNLDNLAPSLDNLNQYTIEFWVKFDFWFSLFCSVMSV